MAEATESNGATGSTESKKTRQRSPAYPAFDLRAAVEKIAKLRRDLGPGFGLYDTVVTNMSYDIKSGSGGRAIATLLSYGLLDEAEGSKPRKFKVSELGNKISLLEPEDNPDRIAAIQTAARNPKIYAEIIDRWEGHLPPDVALGNYLKTERAFNPAAVDGLISDFRATYEFARLNIPGTITQQTGGTRRDSPAGSSGDSKPLPPPEVPHGMKELAIPLGGDSQVILHYPTNLTSDDFDFFAAMLRRLKKRITVAPPEFRTGRALWSNVDHDEPVTVTGNLGMRDGRQYVSVEGSTAGVPLDEITFTDE